MPVELEFVTEPGDQDWIDLEKIYLDYPELPSDEPRKWISNQIEIGKALIGARFNGRLIGALFITPENNSWKLSEFCVRKVTRRRGVARQLLQNLQRTAAEKAIQISADLSETDEAMAALLTELDFKRSNDQLRWKAIGQ